MARQNMPAAEVDIHADLVRRLLQAQRPELGDQTIAPLAFGWDNVSFRVGTTRVARLPRRAMAAGLIENEARWLGELEPNLPLPIPAPEFVGEPGEGYPWRWLVVPYLKGQSASLATLDQKMCASQMGEFLTALHRPAAPDAPENPFRGGPLSGRDGATRERLDLISDRDDRARLEELWDESLTVSQHQEEDLWIHGDLHPHNILADEGRLSAVIDFGDITAGDPATDLAVAWSLVPSAHERLWDVYMGTTPPLRLRARGWAISLSLAYLANSADNELMGTIGERTLRAVLELS